MRGYTTRIDTALRLVQKELFNEKHGGRPGIPKILVILTDGSQTKDADAEDPVKIANEISASGIIVLVVGIGKGINAQELLNIAGGKSEHLFNAASFNELVSLDFVKKFTKISCNTGNCIYSNGRNKRR